jgi:hypothetical protein
MNESQTELSKLLEIEKKYYELLYGVASKYPNETRHETALRYIQERENDSINGDSECKPNKHVKVPKYGFLTEGYDPDKLTRILDSI